MNSNPKDIDEILKNLFNEDIKIKNFQLEERFKQRLEELQITKHQVCKALGIENKTLDAVLSGESKKIDFITITKLSNFLETTPSNLIEKYFDLTLDTHNQSIETAKTRSFIISNFDLPQLKKVGFIDGINDFDLIEKKIINFFGYDTIFEFGQNKISAALSSGKRKSGKKSLKFWFDTVYKSIEKTPNPHPYDREGLINYFPQIRSHSTDVENGMVAVAQKLFKLGITLIIVPKFGSDAHLKGATFNYNGKPCIALTKYSMFYPTLWLTLIHELFHVLYDWKVIEEYNFHFSLDENQKNDNEISEIINDSDIDEDEANDFAREYLFSKNKLNQVIPHIDEPLFIEKYAKENHVHPSVIYSFYLWDNNRNNLYAKYHKYFPKESYQKLLNNFNVDNYLTAKPLKEINRTRNINLNYNTI